MVHIKEGERLVFLVGLAKLSLIHESTGFGL